MLRDKVIKGVGWNAVQHFGRQGIKFIISIIMARLLLPEHFGVIGILMVFTAILQTAVDSGLGQALIQKQDATHIDKCSIFYTNILLSILIYIALCFAAPLISSFYNMQQLNTLMPVQGFHLVINAFGLIQSTQLTQDFDFKSQGIITIASITISGSIGIIMAYSGFGVWSLVTQSLSGCFINTVGLWIMCNWRPSFCFSIESIRSLLGFGSRVLAAGLFDTFFRNIYTLVIGKLFSPADLGYYTKGSNLVQLPIQSLAVIVRRVTFPVFSSIQDDRTRIKVGMRKVLAMLFFVNCPIIFGIASVSDTLVRVLLTEKWIQCVPYIQLLCISGWFYPLHVVNIDALLSIGRSDLYLKLELIKKSLIILALAITWRWGIEAMILGQICQSVIAVFINGYYTKRCIGYSYWEQIRDVFPYLLAAILMGLSVYSLQILPFGNHLAFLLFCQIIVGASSYLLICLILRLTALEEVIEIIKTLLIKRQKPAIVRGSF